MEAGPGPQPEGGGLLLAHDEGGGGPVGDLAGVAGGDLAVRLERRLEVGERLDGGALPDALVGADQLVGLGDGAGLLVAVERAHGDDLVVEASLGGGLGGPALALGREGVEVLAGQAPLVRDELGRDALGDEAAHVGVALVDPGAEREAELAVTDGGAHRHLAHDLDAGGHHDVGGAGDDGLGGEVGGLLGRPALAVDGGGGHGLGPAGGQHGVAADVDRLGAGLHHAPHDHVLDDAGIDAGSLGEGVEDLGRQVGGMPPGELAVALAPAVRTASTITAVGMGCSFVTGRPPGRRT